VIRLVALVVGLGLVAACAGDDGERQTTPSTAQTIAAAEHAAAPALLMPTPGVERSEVVPEAPVAALVAGLNDAGFDLLRTQPLDENLVFSPASIGHALLMARAAADEQTGAAIDSAFGLPAGVAAHQAWNAIDQQIAAAAEANERTTVKIADRIWPRADVTPDQAWIDLLAAEHGASSQTLDYARDPEGSRETINAWVGEQTEGLIPELLPAGFIDPDLTVLVLTDTIYFEADWATPFGKYGPVAGGFTRLDGSTTTTEFMQELELADRRGIGDGFAAAEIPYAGGELSMLVIVPDEGRFGELRERLGPELLEEIDTSFASGPYELLLPKWDDASQIDLLRWLERLGAAPGSYPAITQDAFLGAAIHGADISVDELGTVAAAATGLGFLDSGPPEPELSVRADKPFFYVIRHRDTGLVLFAGQVTDPTA
jgi:serpin B